MVGLALKDDREDAQEGHPKSNGDKPGDVGKIGTEIVPPSNPPKRTGNGETKE